MNKSKYISIKVKILTIILPVIILAVGGLIFISYYISSKIIEEKAYSMLDSSAQNQTIQIENWLNNNINIFSTVKQSIGSTDYSTESMKKILNQYYNFNSNFLDGLYISDLNGNVIMADKSKMKSDNVSSSSWFKEGMTHINMHYGNPYKDSKGNMVVSATGLLTKDGEPLGVIGADVTLNKISIIVNSLIDMEDAQAFLVDKNNGMVLASSDSLKVYSTLGKDNSDKFYSKVAEKISQGNYTADSIDKNIVAIKDVRNTNWVLVSYVPQNSIFKSIFSLRNYMIIIAFAALIILVVLTYRTIHRLIKPLNDMSEKIVKMSNGDFTINIDVKGNDEIAVMSESLKRFIEAMRNMLSNIKSISGEQKKQSNESTNISNKLFESSKNQSESMGNLKVVVSELAESTGQIADTATNLAGIVSDTSENGNKVKEKMQETVNISENGKNDMQHVSSAMNLIQTSISELETMIDRVGQSSVEINNIVSMIGDIAESTNLLALNASIEAARAGEAGKGFAVVAEEIGSLANNSSSSVNDISNLVKEINNLIKDVVDKVHVSVEQVNKSTGLITNSVGIFDKIYNIIGESDGLIQSMLKQIADVNNAADNMAAISEEQAASSEEISSTAHEMSEISNNITSDSKNVADGADNLADTAEKLEEEIEIFKL